MKKLLIILLVFTAGIVLYSQEKRAITVEDMWAMKRIGDVALSPDGNLIAFSVTQYSMEENSGQTDIWLINRDGSNLRPLKNSDKRESSPVFTPDGKQISYEMGGQLWVCDLDGKNDKQLTDLYTGASGIRWSNDGSKILFVSMVYPECMTQKCNEDKDIAKEESKVNVEVFTELMYRHWNDWRGPKRSHLFLKDLKSGEVFDLTLSSKFDVPPLALGSANDYNFSPDGKEVAFAMNRSEFLATSTNNDVFTLKLEDVKTKYKTPFKKISVSEGNDNEPVYSPDGRYIAYRSMARAGFEADKYVVALFDRETNTTSRLTEKLDISFGGLVWTPDSKSILATAANKIHTSIYKIDVESGDAKILVEERNSSGISVSSDGKNIVFKQQRSTQPYEIFTCSIDGGGLTQVTSLNKELLSKLRVNEVETFWSKGAAGAEVQSILVKPPFFDPSKKYPLIFLIHGGPQGHWTDNFHYRWNLQMFASRGHVVVAPNPRGSTGYGQKFTDEISQDWGGKVYVDLMNSLDYALRNFSYIDEKNLFAAGASYGGYMINWIEGHSDRFNALVNHDGVYNMESMYGTTEELWFPEWEMGGAPWENKSMYEKWSPSNYVKNFKTPMLVIHGGKDFRVPEGQAFELFTALQKMGVESKFIYFPEETHFVLKPQNARFWWNSVFNWFDKFYVR